MLTYVKIIVLHGQWSNYLPWIIYLVLALGSKNLPRQIGLKTLKNSHSKSNHVFYYRTVLVNTHISYFMSVWQKDQKLLIDSTIRWCLSFKNFFGQLKLFSVDGWPPIDFSYSTAWIFLKEQGYGMGKWWESATFLTKIHRLKLFFIKV